jgi:hypothetical protein
MCSLAATALPPFSFQASHVVKCFQVTPAAATEACNYSCTSDLLYLGSVHVALAFFVEKSGAMTRTAFTPERAMSIRQRKLSNRMAIIRHVKTDIQSR